MLDVSDLGAVAGIRSNSVAPTFIETPMTRLFFEDAAFRASVPAKIKLGRIGAGDRHQPGHRWRLDRRMRPPNEAAE
jgi:NAD(P)-dependent dehydrogenase (short-subunit alcohol dehydrogenase family)